MQSVHDFLLFLESRPDVLQSIREGKTEINWRDIDYHSDRGEEYEILLYINLSSTSTYNRSYCDCLLAMRNLKQLIYNAKQHIAAQNNTTQTGGKNNG